MNVGDHSFDLSLLFILTIGFTLASIFGYLTNRIKLSPLLGYLIAGYLIGPFSPGIVANTEIAEQLAEVGVILMMFGVGLHFRVKDLLKVKNIAIPGAVIQTLITALVTTWILYLLNWSLQAAAVLGFGIGVASTVVLLKLLTENDLINTHIGHISVGWLIVEDIITVFILLILPNISSLLGAETVQTEALFKSISWTILKFIILIAVISTVGKQIIKYLLSLMVKTGSHELFTLIILAITFVIAVGSTYLFGTSLALGAFIAGMVIGTTDVRHQVSVNATPLRDTFLVLFFLSVGMLFNPMVIIDNFLLFLLILGIILILKPLIAFVIALMWKHPVRGALTLAFALAQIGEFSFILAESALRLKIFPNLGYDMIVACAIVSIAINPILFKLVKPRPLL